MEIKIIWVWLLSQTICLVIGFINGARSLVNYSCFCLNINYFGSFFISWINVKIVVLVWVEPFLGEEKLQSFAFPAIAIQIKPNYFVKQSTPIPHFIYRYLTNVYQKYEVIIIFGQKNQYSELLPIRSIGAPLNTTLFFNECQWSI